MLLIDSLDIFQSSSHRSISTANLQTPKPLFYRYGQKRLSVSAHICIFVSKKNLMEYSSKCWQKILTFCGFLRDCGGVQTTVLRHGALWPQFWGDEESGVCGPTQAQSPQSTTLSSGKIVKHARDTDSVTRRLGLQSDSTQGFALTAAIWSSLLGKH